MIGLPSSSGGANISTGLNQGSAQVLDTSSFDPITFVQNINKERERRELEKQKKQLDLNAKWAKVGTPNVSYVTDYNIEELNKQVDDYSKFITESMKKGVDPETDIELRNALQKMQMGILQTEQMSKGVDAAVKAYSEKAKGYPPEQWAQWNEGLKMQPTVKDRLNYVQTNNPFEEIIDPLELLADVIDPKVLEEVTQDYLGNGRQRTTTGYDQDGLKKILDVSLYNNPAKKNEIEAYYRQGKFQSADEMQANLYEVALTMMPKEKTETTVGWKPSGGGGLNFNFGGGATKGKYGYQATQSPEEGLTTDGDNVVAISASTGTDVRPLSLQASGSFGGEIKMGEVSSLNTLKSNLSSQIKKYEKEIQNATVKPTPNSEEAIKKAKSKLDEAKEQVRLVDNKISEKTKESPLASVVPVRYVKKKDGKWYLEGKRGQSKGYYKLDEAEEEANKIGGSVVDVGGGLGEVIGAETKTVLVELSATNRAALQAAGHALPEDLTKSESGGKATSSEKSGGTSTKKEKPY